MKWIIYETQTLRNISICRGKGGNVEGSRNLALPQKNYFFKGVIRYPFGKFYCFGYNRTTDGMHSSFLYQNNVLVGLCCKFSGSFLKTKRIFTWQSETNICSNRLQKNVHQNQTHKRTYIYYRERTNSGPR